MLGPFLDGMSDGAREEFLALVRAEVDAALRGVSTSDDNPPWLSVAEAGERLGISEGAVRAAIKRGTLPSHRIERRLILKLEDVDALPTRNG